MVPRNLPMNNKFLAQSSCTKLVQNMFTTHIELLAHVLVSFKVNVAQTAGVWLIVHSALKHLCLKKAVHKQ